MNSDDFENHLREQPLRQVPPEWRKDILDAARTRSSPAHDRLPWLGKLMRQLSILLWPSPKAWGGLAAVWVVILALQHSMPVNSEVLARGVERSPAQVLTDLREQQRILVELLGPPEPREADRPKQPVPRQRSQLHRNSLLAYSGTRGTRCTISFGVPPSGGPGRVNAELQTDT